MISNAFIGSKLRKEEAMYFAITKIFLILILASVLYLCEARTCALVSDCTSFEHCCKGNCTSKRIRCEHICHSDHDCDQGGRCVLGLCVNCSTKFPCEWKKCLNDTHCPSGHSCNKEMCEKSKPYNLSAEMAPFVIFIAALAVSMMIVCYNDYFLERIGHRGCMNYLRNIDCNCRLTLWFWMWRLRRAAERHHNSSDSCQPEIEVNFNSLVRARPQRMANEKTQRYTCLSLSLLSRRLFWWQRQENSERISSDDSSENRQDCDVGRSVLLLNECVNGGSDTHDQTPTLSNHKPQSGPELDRVCRSASSTGMLRSIERSNHQRNVSGCDNNSDGGQNTSDRLQITYLRTQITGNSNNSTNSDSCSVESTNISNNPPSEQTNSISLPRSTGSHTITIV